MFKQRKAKARDRGQEIWFLLPESERTAARVRNELLKEGLEVSKATAARWANGWRAVAHKAVDLMKFTDGSERHPRVSRNRLTASLRTATRRRRDAHQLRIVEGGSQRPAA